MSRRANDSQRELIRNIYAAEVAVWSGMTLFALVLFASTLAADFPARPRALVGELFFGAVAAAGLGMALARTRRGQPLLTGRWRWSRSGVVQGTLVLCRVLLGVPALAVGLISAAAGFAA